MSVITKVITKLFGRKSDKDLKALWPAVEEVNKISPTLASLTDEELREKFLNVRKIIETNRSEARKFGLSEKLK